jgi:hypothetical protein
VEENEEFDLIVCDVDMGRVEKTKWLGTATVAVFRFNGVNDQESELKEATPCDAETMLCLLSRFTE